MNRSTTWFGIAVTALLAGPLVACSSPEPGTPRASDNTETKGQPTTSTSKAKPTTSSASSPLDSLDPCELLSDQDVAAFGVGAGKKKNFAGARGCDWMKSGDFGFSIGLNGDRGLKDANYQGGTPAPIDIGKHEATKLENMGGGDGSCSIFIAITDSSLVHITATASGLSDTPKACAKALAVAQLIDPKLP